MTYAIRTTDHDDNLLIHRGTVALSNAGVTLMQNHCYTGGRHVLQTALTALKCLLKYESEAVTSQASLPDTLGDNISVSNILSLITCGMKRVQNSTVETRSPWQIHVVMDDDDPLLLEQYLRNIQFSDNSFMIRLNSLLVTSPSSVDCSEDDSSSITSAVILQNIATCHLCMSHCVNCTDDEADFLLKASYELYRSSEVILYSMVQSTREIHLLPEAALCLSIVLRNLIQVTFHLGYSKEHALVRSRLQEVNRLITHLHSMEMYNSNRVHSPAA